MPKHKGTDKLQADLKAKISKLKSQVESGPAKHGAHRADAHSHIVREGAAQVILIGPPNTGKSSLLASLTHARPLIGDYPFTTQEPLAGMTEFETVHFQLIDTPPISAEHMEPYLPNLVRAADLVVFVLDLAAGGLQKQFMTVAARLEEKHIIICPRASPDAHDPRMLCKKTLVAAHKYLDAGGEQAVAQARALYPGFNFVPTSISDLASLERFKAAIFTSLDIIRVYTKRIGHDPEYKDPIILPVGGTVEQAALSIHKDFAHKLQFAKVWGAGKFEGQRVKNSFVLSDKDVIEFHI